MFESTNAKMKKNGDNVEVHMQDGKTFTIMKEFEFDHKKMTQGVIVQNEQGEMKVFVKGSAESIKARCKSSSVPSDFDSAVKESAESGIYQISLAMKNISKDDYKNYEKNQELSRNDVESELEFLGFVNFVNEVKEESMDVLKQLREGDIKTMMLTGDNVLTGIKVASECGMIESGTAVILGEKILPNGEIDWYDINLKKSVQLPSEPRDLSQSDIALAVTGKVWQYLIYNNQSYALSICDYIRIYGRCTPQDKVNVVSYFIHKGKITLMCGDGGNDCGALKTAHVGIALSEAEASMVSPFTSLEKSITSVVDVLKEGRCALSSAFASYKYMLMYGQIATVNQIAAGYFYTTFSEWSWVFLDGVWLIALAFSLPLATPSKKLAPSRPTSSLFGWQTLSSYLGVLAFNVLFVAIALNFLFRQEWFLCRSKDSNTVEDVYQYPDNYETEVIFIVSGFQIIISAMVFNFGYAHRAMWIKNSFFVVASLVFVFIHLYIIMVPGYLSCVFRVNCDNEVSAL